MILDLSRHADKEVLVRLSGGRQVRGILKGWDPLLNLVLDEAVEELRGAFATTSIVTIGTAFSRS